MDTASLIRETMMVILKLGGPLLLIALITGLIVSILQAVTQINEATLSFVPKVIGLGIALVLLGPFMFSTLQNYTHLLLDRVVAVGAS